MSQNKTETAAPNFYKHEDASQQPSYNPQAFIHAIKTHLNLKNDAAVARALQFTPPVISKLRHKSMPVTPLIMLRVIEATGWTVKQARKALGA